MTTSSPRATHALHLVPPHDTLLSASSFKQSPTSLTSHTHTPVLFLPFSPQPSDSDQDPMAEIHHLPSPYYTTPKHQTAEPGSQQVAKAATAVTAGGSLLILSGLILSGTVIGLTIATPLFVIFSPVLVPALIAVALLSTGFLASGGFGVAAITVLSWIYRYVTGQYPPDADQLHTARHKPMNKTREIKDYGQQNVAGVQAS